MRVAWILVLAACEPAEPTVTAPPPTVPDAPELESIRTSSTVNDTKPAAAPIAPDLVGLRTPLKSWFLALTASERHAVRAICRIRQKDPCAGLMPNRKALSTVELPPPERIDVLLASLAMEDRRHTHSFCVETTGSFCDTPLVVSFDGAPVEFTPATDDRFAFRGVPARTDWPSAKTPWIAIDRDGDGAITSGVELFGDATAKNGYAALAQLDSNYDGVIDRDDPAFAQLLLWADANADRKSTPDELRPLASAVVAIPLAHDVEARCAGGNCEGEHGIAHLPGGRTGAVVDIYLAER